ncbi:N,N-dimethylformamidase beta subunit family domain-containing protein [Pseudomonas sp. RIT-PI-q]|uniref:N,N-dimethylformamidase beta subunit family domain-containing protein n=1 Tax=Pseudomonas sp. RIT-PI-q TaxID=1690247 RepID=UPI0009EB8192|nr:N,N-dimethylformamidase beta subunit family domain-containing protein [Pseudomonas sp. RIT-PI-q]
MKITAYSETLSFFPGDNVDIKVSAEGGATYCAELRRIIQGDINPKGPGYKDELVQLPLGGPFKARMQQILTGSYGVVPHAGHLATTDSFTVAGLIWPTLPGENDQTIISIGNVQNGCTLYLNEAGAATFTISNKGISITAQSPVLCRARSWYLIVGVYNRISQTVEVIQHALNQFPGINDSGRDKAQCDKGAVIKSSDPVSFGASFTEGKAANFFNGKIENPKVYHAAEEFVEVLNSYSENAEYPKSLAANWDFSRLIETNRFVETRSNLLNGCFINLPSRAVSGFRWDGKSHCWNECPDHYAAVHFHDDDLYDAGWETDISFKIPDSLKSGVFAVRLFSPLDSSQEFFVVIFVKAKKVGGQKNKLVFIAPTASYTAYANHRFGLDYSETEIAAGQLVQIDKHHQYLQKHVELGLSLYDLHRDGSVVFYSSRLRPVLDFQPKVQGYMGGTGSNVWQFNADTHILGFLEHCDISYDVITDEDLEREGVAALSGYQAIITGSHPEYTSTNMLDAYKQFLGDGGRIFYSGGNGFYWRIAYSPNFPGAIECRRAESGIRGGEPGVGNYWHQFTGELGGLWRRLGRAPQELFGVGMTAQGFDLGSPYIKTADGEEPRARFIYEGVEDTVLGNFGLHGNGAAGLEIDRADFTLGTPPHALIVGSSVKHTDLFLVPPEESYDPLPICTGTQSHLIRADMTFFETSAGGAVFSTGSISWAASMAWNGYENNISIITENVIRRFIDPQKFTMDHSNKNINETDNLI